jgi:hypothetical protein
LETLGELASPQTHGVLISMFALGVIEGLGDKLGNAARLVRAAKPKGPSPDGRYNSYVPRLDPEHLGRMKDLDNHSC